MGNKHDVAPVVAELVRRRRGDRPFLDVFCGLCSVGGAVARTGHRVVGNDVQSFAALVARCLVATVEMPPSREKLKDSLWRSHLYNQRRLLERFGDDVAREARILANADAHAQRCCLATSGKGIDAPGKIRTCDLSLRRRLAGERLSGENRVVMRDCGMDRGDLSLGGWPRFAGDSGR